MGDSRLSITHRKMIADGQNTKLVSLASIWEIAIKTSLRKLEIPAELDILVPKEMAFFNITMPHLLKVQSLPHYHGDPFDRMIIAQALTEDIAVMSDDPNFPPYGVKLV